MVPVSWYHHTIVYHHCSSSSSGGGTAGGVYSGVSCWLKSEEKKVMGIIISLHLYFQDLIKNQDLSKTTWFLSKPPI